jgi:hypothetical protein
VPGLRAAVHVPVTLLQRGVDNVSLQEITMTTLALDEFFRTCVHSVPEEPGLSLDELYGLYVSWCSLTDRRPAPDRTFRKVLTSAGICPQHRNGRCEGLAMTGPAALDYLVHCELPLLSLDGSGPGAEAVPDTAGSSPPGSRKAAA